MKVLLVANVAKEHILKFHIPTIKRMREIGWVVDVACSGQESVPYCNEQYEMLYKRSPFSIGTIRGIIQLSSIIKLGNYDAVYCHTPVGGLASRLAARKYRKTGLRVIYMAHGFHFYKGASIINWLVYYPIELILSFWTDIIIAVNNEDYKNAQRILKCKRVELVNEIGIDIARFSKRIDNIRKVKREELNIPDDAYVMVYMAELIPNKNQTLLIDTLKYLRDNDKDFYLLLAGIDHNNGRDALYAEKLGVDSFIRFVGWRDDVEALYQCSDICTASSIREGFGLNIVEAMASGLPVVATANRGHSSIIIDGENGYLVPLGDPAEFGNKILQALENKEQLMANYELSAYDSKTNVAKIINIIESA